MDYYTFYRYHFLVKGGDVQVGGGVGVTHSVSQYTEEWVGSMSGGRRARHRTRPPQQCRLPSAPDYPTLLEGLHAFHHSWIPSTRAILLCMLQYTVSDADLNIRHCRPEYRRLHHSPRPHRTLPTGETTETY